MPSLYRKGWWPSRSFRPCVISGIENQNIWVTHIRNCCWPVKMTENWNSRDLWQQTIWVDWKKLVATPWVEIPVPLSGQYPAQGLGGLAVVAFLFLLTVWYYGSLIWQKMTWMFLDYKMSFGLTSALSSDGDISIWIIKEWIEQLNKLYTFLVLYCAVKMNYKQHI